MEYSEDNKPLAVALMDSSGLENDGREKSYQHYLLLTWVVLRGGEE